MQGVHVFGDFLYCGVVARSLAISRQAERC